MPEEEKWVLWPSVLISSWTELHACVGEGHSCCVKRALAEDSSCQLDLFYLAGICDT